MLRADGVGEQANEQQGVHNHVFAVGFHAGQGFALGTVAGEVLVQKKPGYTIFFRKFEVTLKKQSHESCLRNRFEF